VRVSVDQVIEQSINRVTKILSLKPSTVQRWIVTPHEQAAIAKTCKQFAGMNANFVTCKESGVAVVNARKSLWTVLSE
jgi:hypothetical protein